MFKLLKYISELTGKVIGSIVPLCLGEYIEAVIAHIYTGFLMRRFLSWGKGSVIAFKARKLSGIDNVKIGENVQLGQNLQLTAWSTKDHKAYIEIGDNCIIREDCHITCANMIKIGKNLLTGNYVLITDNSHGNGSYEEMLIHPGQREVFTKGPVTIGDNVWLGNHVCVLPGVTIGDGAIIGAGSIVTKDIPAYSIAAGVPAKIVKRNINQQIQ